MRMRPGGEDLILVLGGDGSILRALAREAGSGAPVIGVNYGRVGFLASIERETLERDLRRALAGEYVVLGLPSLKAEWGEGEVQAVNDLALFRGGESRIADLTYAVDGELVATVRCDGVVMSTPVGSTAYNLAAGGPTVSWRVRCFVLSFIALHHLDSRPLVIGAEEKLTVTNSALVGDCEHPGRRPAHRRAAPRPLDHRRPGRGRGPPGDVPRGLVLPALPGEVRPAVIRALEVRDLVVIERAEIAPPAGLTAITGETGAGKTVLAQALGCWPARPPTPAPVRPGARHALVQATLAVPDGFWDRLEDDDPAAAAARAGRGRGRGRARAPGARRGPGPGDDRRPGGAARGGRGAGPGADALLRPARAPPAGEPGQPARRARRLRRGRRRGRAPSGCGRCGAALARVSTGRSPRPARGARRPSASGPTSRSWWRRSMRPPSTSTRRPPSAPSASGCATPRAWRRPPRRAAEALSPADERRARGAVDAVGGAGRALEPLVGVDAGAGRGPTPTSRAPRRRCRRRRWRCAPTSRTSTPSPAGWPRWRSGSTTTPASAAAHGPGTEAVLARADEAREALRGLDEGAGERAGPRRGARGR